MVGAAAALSGVTVSGHLSRALIRCLTPAQANYGIFGRHHVRAD